MKTRVLLALTLLVVSAVSAQAANSIVGSKHDLSMSQTAGASIHSTTQNQTCVFCHAPHNAKTNKLLWNRVPVAGSTMLIYTSYNTSAMNTEMKKSATYGTLDNGSSSLLCLSCHALSTANVAMVVTNSTGGGTDSGDTGTWATKTGNMSDLRNSHPVGIDYDGAQTIATASGLNASASGKVGVLRLFKSSVAANTLECASCHSVHDSANGKFLANTNDNSALCVICHKK